MPSEGENGTSLADHNYAYLARPTIVLNNPTDDRSRPKTVTRTSRPITRANRRNPFASTSRINATGSLKNIRKNARNPALSTAAKSLLQGKLSCGTKKTYEGPWKRWRSWCNQMALDPVSTIKDRILCSQQNSFSYISLSWSMWWETRWTSSAYHRYHRKPHEKEATKTKIHLNMGRQPGLTIHQRTRTKPRFR